MSVAGAGPSQDRIKGMDRVMSVLGTIVTGYAELTSRSRTREAVPVDRELRLVVARAELEASDVMSLTLSAADGGELPEWTPGAHLDLVLPSERVRQYSLCGDPDDRTSYRIAVRRLAAGRGGSVEVHGLAPGTTVRIRGPRNAFPFAYPHLARRDISEVAFIAGGIGITALLPMVAAAERSRTPWSLTYVGRDESTMPFLPELRSLGGGEIRVLHGVPPIPEVLADVGGQTSVYFCGPPPFLDDVSEALRDRPHAGFHFERFSPPPVLGGHPFRMRLARSNIEVDVPADTSALAAVREALPAVSYSCQQGFCGTCRVGVLAGAVSRRGTSTFLERPDSMLICVDRADHRSDDTTVTIDL